MMLESTDKEQDKTRGNFRSTKYLLEEKRVERYKQEEEPTVNIFSSSGK